LEETLGVRLFERTKRTVRLTPEGEYLKREISQTFRHLDAVKSGLTLMREGGSGLLSIGYVGAAMHAVLPALLKKFLNRYKTVTIHLHEMDNQQQLDALRKGTIDIGFVRSSMDDSAIGLFAIHQEPLTLVTPKHIRLRALKPDALAPLKEMPFIGFPHPCAPDLVKSIYNILDRLKLAPKQVHESSQINSIVRIVETGIGYSILPASTGKVYKIDVNTYDLSSFRERAKMYAAVNTERQTVLVKNFLAFLQSKKS
jgi:DNA-binding transcriptional LysR family regulator